MPAPEFLDARDARDRLLARRAVSVSAAGLALTGLAELGDFEKREANGARDALRLIDALASGVDRS